MQPFNIMVFLILFSLMLSMARQVACICIPSVRAWAEDKYLRVATPRVLPAYRKAKEVEDIYSLLAANRSSVVRWTPYPESQVPASYRVEVLLERFEGTLGDSVLLRLNGKYSPLTGVCF